MKGFAAYAGVDWRLSPHQLRRAYAWTFVRHRLGNVLFLKEQFKHSSIEMTQLYAANPMQDDALFEDLFTMDKFDEELVTQSREAARSKPLKFWSRYRISGGALA